MKVALLYLFAASASAQTLTPVTAPAGSGIPWWVWPLVGLLIVAAGFVWLKVKKPTVAAKVETDAEALGKMIGAATKAAVEHIQANPPMPAAVITTTAPPDLQPALDTANGKLAQIKAIVDA